MENLVKVYERQWIVDHIYSESDRVRNKVTNIDSMEREIFRRVSRHIEDYLQSNEDIYAHSRIIRKKIGEVIKKHSDDRRNQYYEVFTQYETIDEDGETLEFEPVDVLANVESEVIKKETASMLAQGDRRNEIIVENWLLGNTNGKNISHSLARTLGGKPESHRKYIQRFRQSCTSKIEAMA